MIVKGTTVFYHDQCKRCDKNSMKKADETSKKDRDKETTRIPERKGRQKKDSDPSSGVEVVTTVTTIMGLVVIAKTIPQERNRHDVVMIPVLKKNLLKPETKLSRINLFAE